MRNNIFITTQKSQEEVIEDLSTLSSSIQYFSLVYTPK